MQPTSIYILGSHLQDQNQIRPKSPAELRELLFTKFFPKYLQTTPSNMKKGYVRSKIKRTKIIHHFNFPFTFCNLPAWRILLANKTKSVKSLDSSDESSSQFAQKIKVLSGLKSVSISLRNQGGLILKSDRKRDKHLEIASRRLNLLRSLQSLSISNLSKNNKKLLEKLNSFSRLLDSLTMLHLHCDEKGCLDPGLLHLIQSKKNILKSMTSLDLGSLCSPSHYQSFQNLANSCPKLQRLSFEFTSRTITHPPLQDKRFSESSFPVETNYLSTLKTFQNLQTLSLNIADTFTCLKDLVFPSSIQNLCLNFEECLSKEILSKIDSTFSIENSLQFFEKNQTLRDFYNKFRCLDHLEALDIYFSFDSDPKSYHFQSYLLHYLLKRIPSKLKKLTNGFSARCFGLNKKCSFEIRDYYLPLFFESCHNFGQSLTTLELGHEEIAYFGFDLSASQNKFPQLSRIKIIGKFEEYQGSNLPHLLPLIEQLILLGNSISRIELLILTENTVKSLLSLLQQVNKLKMPSKLFLEIEVRFPGSRSLQDLKAEELKDVIYELWKTEKFKAKRVSLTIYTNINSVYMRNFLDVFGQRFEEFKVLQTHLSYSTLKH